MARDGGNNYEKCVQVRQTGSFSDFRGCRFGSGSSFRASVRYGRRALGRGGSIAIPGCETLSLAAGRTRQSVRIENPKGNPCYFRVSLLLSDGETLWTSRLMKPGKSISSLTLSHPLDAGEYAATLKYDCFSLTDKTPLNGAEIRLTMRMQ